MESDFEPRNVKTSKRAQIEGIWGALLPATTDIGKKGEQTGFR